MNRPERVAADPARVADLFAEALERAPTERSAFLDAACAGSADLRAEVESLLSADEGAGGFLAGLDKERGIALLGAALEPEPAGRRVGPYRILSELGRGGMGIVYLAERAEGGFEQRVAVKLIKRGMDTEAILKRFLRERQILASLEHPNVARLLDGGVTDDAQPYFAMEYVDGEPLTAYCDGRRLGIEERLHLFEGACRAVQHAHGKLVVHRDLKPSNMQVTRQGELKLLDFGIAKLLAEEDESAAAASTLTQAGNRPLTPDYAAPEQLRGDPVTTATDIYALGVVLHELLTGRRPHRISAAAPEAEAPSVAVKRSCGDFETRDSRTREEIAAARGLTPRRLYRRLAGDLDTVILKALRLEPERRYASAEAMAEDIGRHLAGLPVRAQPDTLAYRSGKFVKRHAVGVMATAAVVLLIVGLTSFYTVRLARERDRARREATKAEQVAGFLSGLFELSDPERSKGQKLTAREILDRGAADIDAKLRDQPALQADMMMLIGEVYRQLGLYREAHGLYDKAHANRVALLGENSPETAESLRKVGLALHLAGRYEEARPLLERARAAFERLGNPVGLAGALNDLGNLHRATGDLAGARALHEKSVALKEVHEPDSSSLAKSLNNLGLVLTRLGEREEAQRVYERALALHERTSGPDSILVAQTLDNLAWVMAEAGRPSEALPLAQRSLEIQEKTLGEHRMVANALNTLGRLASNTGDGGQAVAYYERSLAMFEKTAGPEHPDTAFPMSNLGKRYMEGGETRKALQLYERALGIRQRTLGPDHQDVAASLRDVAGARAKLGDSEIALDLYHRSLATWRKRVPPEDLQIAETLLQLGRLLAHGGRCSEARPLLTEALALRRAKLAADDPKIAEVEETLRRCGA